MAKHGPECFFILARVFSLTTLKWSPRSLLLSKFFPIPGLQLRSISRLIYELATKSYNHLVLHLNIQHSKSQKHCAKGRFYKTMLNNEHIFKFDDSRLFHLRKYTLGFHQTIVTFELHTSQAAQTH